MYEEKEKYLSVQGVSRQGLLYPALAWAHLRTWFMSELEPCLAWKFHYLQSMCQAQLGNPTYSQAQAESGSDFEFVSKPSRTSSDQQLLLDPLCHGSHSVTLKIITPPEHKPSLWSHLVLSPNRAQLQNSKIFWASAEPRLEFDFVTEPSWASPARACLL